MTELDDSTLWRSARDGFFGIFFGFDALVRNITEAYIVGGYQLKEVQNASKASKDPTSIALSRPLCMMLPPPLTIRMSTTSNPTTIPIAALAPAAVSEPMNLSSMQKLCEELHAYIGEQRNETPGDVPRCFNSGYRETDRKIAARIQHPSDEWILIGHALELPVKSTARIKRGHFSHAPRGEKGLHS